MSTIRHRYYTCGFHSDVIWLEDQRDYAVVLMGCMGQNLQACRADDDYGVFLHELTYLKPYLDSHPLDRPLFFDLLKAGRIGMGGAHSLPSENLISGEAFIRNFAYGRAYHEYLGDRPEVAMLWDVFGHCSQLPQMLAGMRFTGLIWSKDIRGAHPLFWHQGLDATRLLTRRVMYGHVDSPRETVEQHLDQYLPELESLGHDVDLRVHCNDFTPPAGWIVGRSGELARKAELPWLISGQAHRHYFREIHKQARRKQFHIPTSARDFEYHHEGTGLAHIDLKILNRLCENELIEAEKWSSLAALQGLPYPHYSLDKAWRQVFFGQHHDAITGPCCDRAYVDLMDGYREALELARAAGQRARGWLAEQVRQSKAQGIPLVVFNGLNWQRRDVVEQTVSFDPPVESFVVQDGRGEEIPFEARMVERANGLITQAAVRFVAEAPPLGHATYRVVPVSKALPKLKSGKRTQIENEHYRLRVDATHGGIVSLWDKRLETELLGEEPGNELVALAEDFASHPEPPWELNTSGAKVFSRDFPAKVRLEQGPISSTLTITGKFKDCRRVQRITLYQGLPRIEFETQLQRYDGREDLIAVTFPAALPGATPVFDDRFGCVTKRRSRGKLDYRTWQWRNYSDSGARRAYQWVDLSSSARLVLEDGKEVSSSYGLGPMSLVFGEGEGLEEALNGLQAALVRRGVTSTVFRDDCERRRRCALPREDSTMPVEHPNEDLPWGTAFRLIADLDDTNLLWQALRAELDEGEAQRLQQRRAKDGVAVVFALDANVPEGWAPLPTLVVTGLSVEAVRKLLAQMGRELARTGAISLPAESDLSPAPATLPDWGLALLNRGTPLQSVEADGTLVLMLMHCVPWARTPWGPDRLDFHLVAEHKTHRFEYALQPHGGDWREGDTVRGAYEYNNPLQVVQTMGQGGKLAGEMSYCEIEGGIVTALKPAGYAIPQYERPEELPLLLRVYEPHGEQSKLTVEWPGGLADVQRSNMLDEPQEALPLQDAQLTVGMRPFEIGSYLLSPRAAKQAGALPEHEEGVIPSRYWQHNVGEAPMGYMPVSVTLSGEVQTNTHVMHGGYTVNALTVGVANNLRETARGKVRLIVAEGWRTLPEEVEFVVPAQGGAEYPVTLIFDDRRREGVVRAQLEWAGQVYEDVLVVGEPPAPVWTAKVKKDVLRVAVENPGVDVLNADLYLIAPHEAWEGIPARRVPLALGPGEKTELTMPLKFPNDYDTQDLWLIAKLAYRGQVEYKPVIL